MLKFEDLEEGMILNWPYRNWPREGSPFTVYVSHIDKRYETVECKFEYSSSFTHTHAVTGIYWNNYIADLVTEKEAPAECECGADKIKSTHSNWCPKHV